MRHAIGSLVIFASSSAQAFGDPSVLLSTRANQIATFAIADAANTSETIARDASFDPALRRSVALEGVRLRVMLGDRAGTQAIVTVARTLQPTRAQVVALDAAMTDLDWADWQTGRGDRTAQMRATTSLTTFFTQHRLDADAREHLVTTAWRLSRIKHYVGAADSAEWSRATVAAWYAFDGAQHPVASVAPFVDEVAEAEFALVDDDLAKLFPSPHTCRYATYTSDRARIDAFDVRLERMRAKHSSSAWLAGVEARRALLFDALHDGLWRCGTLSVVPLGVSQVVAQYQLTSLNLIPTKPTATQAAALATYAAARQRRDDWIADTRTLAWQHFARSFDAYALADGPNDELQHAARRADSMRIWLGDASTRRVVQGTTSGVRVGAPIDYERVLRVMNALMAAPP